jgi:hypothetical protein
MFLAVLHFKVTKDAYSVFELKHHSITSTQFYFYSKGHLDMTPYGMLLDFLVT